jgi:hypothetical protein
VRHAARQGTMLKHCVYDTSLVCSSPTYDMLCHSAASVNARYCILFDRRVRDDAEGTCSFHLIFENTSDCWNCHSLLPRRMSSKQLHVPQNRNMYYVQSLRIMAGVSTSRAIHRLSVASQIPMQYSCLERNRYKVTGFLQDTYLLSYSSVLAFSLC